MTQHTELAPAAEAAPTEYTIEALAKAARTRVRNVRAYQDRGLLPAPERRGRSAIYGPEHLSRLRIIGQLLARGYTLSSIGELIEALEKGQDLARLMGLESAVASPWTDERPAYFSLVELVKMFGGSFHPRWLLRASELDILRPVGARFLAPSPRMIHAGAQLVKAGIPLDEMLEVVQQLRRNVEQAADGMVQLIERHLFDRYGKGLPPAAEAPRLGEVVWRLRPLVEMAVHAEVARAMEKSANRHLGDRLAHVLDQMAVSRSAPRDTR